MRRELRKVFAGGFGFFLSHVDFTIRNGAI
jgi:hypothetical protein